VRRRRSRSERRRRSRRRRAPASVGFPPDLYTLILIRKAQKPVCKTNEGETERGERNNECVRTRTSPGASGREKQGDEDEPKSTVAQPGPSQPPFRSRETEIVRGTHRALLLSAIHKSPARSAQQASLLLVRLLLRGGARVNELGAVADHGLDEALLLEVCDRDAGERGILLQRATER
jgi:hypothetical protein